MRIDQVAEVREAGEKNRIASGEEKKKKPDEVK
jgi:hypothetical protein